MLNKVIIHQQLFILFTSIFLLLNVFLSFDGNYLNYLIWIALFFVGTLGVSHGALDGKLIWKGINKNFQRFILFILYLFLVLSGWALWISFPAIGLTILLVMSVFHFGNADLKLLKLDDINIKLSWGFTMTFLPILFKKDIVESIFYNLIGIKIPNSFIAVIYGILILSIIRIYWGAIQNILNSNIIEGKGIGYEVDWDGLETKAEKTNWYTNKDILFLSEFSLLVILSYFMHPFVWFAIYFCGLHGVRSLIDSKFNMNIDFKWIFVFTFPVMLFIGFTYGKYWNADIYSIIFPILGSLTIAHMSLPSLIKFMKR